MIVRRCIDCRQLGQPDRDRRALPRPALQLDTPAMQINDFLDDAQSQTGARDIARHIGPVEAFEAACLLLCRHANAMVTYFNAQ